MWHRELGIWHCHCSSLVHCYGTGSILGLGTFTYCGHCQKNTGLLRKNMKLGVWVQCQATITAFPATFHKVCCVTHERGVCV